MALFGRRHRGPRTADDREAARIERERRRAGKGRRGAPPPPAAPPAEPTSPPEPTQSDSLTGAGETAPPAEPTQSDSRTGAGESAPPAPEAPAHPESAAPPDSESAGAPTQSASPTGAGEPVEPGPAAETPRPEPEPEPTEPHPDPEPVPGGPSHDGASVAPAAVAASGAADTQSASRTGATERASQSTEPFEVVPAGRRTVRLPRPQGPEDREEPIGTVRISRAEYQAQPGASGLPPHRRLGVPRRRRGRFARWLVPLLVLAAFAAAAAFAFLLFQPFHHDGSRAVVVRIAPGLGAKQIGDELADRGVVRSGFFFALRARLRGDRDKLRSGTYTLQKDMSYASALDVLTTPPKAAPVMNVTLPEGPGRRELAARVRAAGVVGSYLAATRRSKLLDPHAYGAPKRTASLEGFLFPSTYQLRRSDATAKRLVADQLRTFKARFVKLRLDRARRRHLSRYDVITIASMIEREALVPRDRRLISAVIYNRLAKDIPLGIDATLRYRLDDWSRPLRRSELGLRSPYNTRKHAGLPPTPIGNPGLASLQAAADPARVGYLYFVVKPCGNGAHAFSSTYAGFQRDYRAYVRARAKRGGKDPSHC